MALNHFPPAPVLNLAQALWLDSHDLEYYDDHTIILHNLDRAKVNNILGLDHEHNVIHTGLRFKDTLDDGRLLISEPFFSATKFIPDEGDIDQYTYGVIHITISEAHYENKLEIDRLKIGENNEVFNLTFIPDMNFPTEDLFLYFNSLTSHLI